MGTMRNNFAGASVIVVLILTTSQSYPLDVNENSFKRHSLPVDTLTLDPRSSSSATIYECLFIDPDLPICDVKWMLNSEKDSTTEGNSFKGHALQRSRRNVDVSAMDVVVYTIEGCLPSRLPFSMPSCEGISLDRIVDIQKFRPFAMKGVTKPPLVFPEFNYPQWLLMMTRLRNHVLSKEDEEDRIVPQVISVDDSIQARTEGLRNAATMKETMPNAIAANMNISKGSSPNRFIPDSSSWPEESMVLGLAGSGDRLRLNSLGKRFENVDDSRLRISKEDSRKILDTQENTMDNEENEQWMDSVEYYGDCRRFEGKDNGIENYFPPLKTGLNIFRPRSIRSVVSSQKISDVTKTRGIGGKSINEPAENTGVNWNRKIKGVAISGKHKKKSKSMKFDERQTDPDKNTSTNGIARHITGSRVGAVNKDSLGKIDALAESKSTWRKSTAKETASGKKYRNHGELQSSRGH